MKNVTRITLFILVVTCLSGFVFVVSAEEIIIDGTDNGAGILKAVGEAFSKLQPDVTIILPPSVDSSGGIRAVGRGERLLGRVARKVKDHEKHYGLTYVPFVKLPNVFFVNKSINIQDLSTQQILEIYSGKTTNWKEVGGSDAKIRVITREETDSARRALEETFPGFKDITITPRSKTTFSQVETIETVENIPGSIAYGSHGNAKAADVNILTINAKSGNDLDYPYVGSLGFVYKEEKYAGNVKNFVEFATSEAAHETIREAGGIPF